MSPQAGELLVQEIAPRIHSSLGHWLPQFGSEDTAELVQEGIALAARLLRSAEARGKKVSAGNISYYATKLVRQGRRSAGLSKTDVMHPATQINGRARVMSLDEPVGGESDAEEAMCLHDVLAGRQEDPFMAASRRLDWKHLLARLDNNAREVLNCLVIGEDLTKLVPRLRRSRSALQTDKERLFSIVREHFGPGILAMLQEQPRWRDNFEANRERAACRYERQTP